MRKVIQIKLRKNKKSKYLQTLEKDTYMYSLTNGIIEGTRIKETYFHKLPKEYQLIDSVQIRFLDFFSPQTLSLMLKEINEGEETGVIQRKIEYYKTQNSYMKPVYKKELSFIYKKNKVISVVANILDENNTIVSKKDFTKKDIGTFLLRLFLDEASLIILLKQNAEFWADETIKELME